MLMRFAVRSSGELSIVDECTVNTEYIVSIHPRVELVDPAATKREDHEGYYLWAVIKLITGEEVTTFVGHFDPPREVQRRWGQFVTQLVGSPDGKVLGEPAPPRS